jgi:cytochrome c peroxidase
MARALAAYVRTLESPPSPFDLGTMSDAARRGQALFEGEARCSGCHTGPAFTDERFHDVGLVDQPGNEGRFAVTGRETDRGRYKTPTLRELTRTAPYFHDGRFATLAEVVDFYDAGGDTTDPDAAIKPLALSPSDKADLVAFLQALSAP